MVSRLSPSGRATRPVLLGPRTPPQRNTALGHPPPSTARRHPAPHRCRLRKCHAPPRKAGQPREAPHTREQLLVGLACDPQPPSDPIGWAGFSNVDERGESCLSLTRFRRAPDASRVREPPDDCRHSGQRSQARRSPGAALRPASTPDGPVYKTKSLPESAVGAVGGSRRRLARAGKPKPLRLISHPAADNAEPRSREVEKWVSDSGGMIPPNHQLADWRCHHLPASVRRPCHQPQQPALSAPPTIPRPMRVIGVTNQNGGSGKISTAVNLAAAVAQLGCSALVLHLDPHTAAPRSTSWAARRPPKVTGEG